jgi:hypothetical protein
MTPSSQWLRPQRHVCWSLKNVRVMSFLCAKGPCFLLIPSEQLLFITHSLESFSLTPSLKSRVIANGQIISSGARNYKFAGILSICIDCGIHFATKNGVPH